MSLMSLPSELRAHIIEFVLLNRRERPSDETQQILKGRRIHPDSASLRLPSQRGTFYEDDDNIYRPCWKSLLLVNHLLNCETKNRLAVFQDKVDYELDILIDKNRNLLPTWISFPLLTKDISRLDVTIRISRSEQQLFDEPDVWGKYSKGSPSFMSYEFFMILSRLLKDGPRPRFRGTGHKKPMTISNLNINIEPPSTVAETCTQEPACLEGKTQQDLLMNCTSRDRYALRDTVFVAHGECLCAWMCRQLEHFLGLTGDFGLCGLRAATSIGLIRLNYNGYLWREFDLGHVIVDFDPPHGSEIYHRLSGDDGATARFEKQRAEMIALRKSRGLPTPDPKTRTQN